MLLDLNKTVTGLDKEFAVMKQWQEQYKANGVVISNSNNNNGPNSNSNNDVHQPGQDNEQRRQDLQNRLEEFVNDYYGEAPEEIISDVPSSDSDSNKNNEQKRKPKAPRSWRPMIRADTTEALKKLAIGENYEETFGRRLVLMLFGDTRGRFNRKHDPFPRSFEKLVSKEITPLFPGMRGTVVISGAYNGCNDRRRSEVLKTEPETNKLGHSESLQYVGQKRKDVFSDSTLASPSKRKKTDTNTHAETSGKQQSSSATTKSKESDEAKPSGKQQFSTRSTTTSKSKETDTDSEAETPGKHFSSRPTTTTSTSKSKEIDTDSEEAETRGKQQSSSRPTAVTKSTSQNTIAAVAPGSPEEKRRKTTRQKRK